MATVDLNAQVIKGLLDALVLGVLARKENYGFGIVREVNAWVGRKREFLHAATLYLLLHRLESKGLLKSYWRPGARGTDRKYYRITKAGRDYLRKRIEDWREVARILDEIILED